MGACALWWGVAVGPALADAPSLAADYAERLAEDPVYLSDHIAGADADAEHAALAEAAGEVGHPTFVLAVPTGHARDHDRHGLLAAVHEQLGADGVYVLLGDVGIVAASFGVEIPELADAEHNASSAAIDGLDLISHADRMWMLVDQLNAPREVEPPESESPADRPADDSAYDGPLAGLVRAHDPGSSTGRSNIAFTAGIAVGGALALAVGWVVTRTPKERRR